jgi:hypothetical protein
LAAGNVCGYTLVGKRDALSRYDIKITYGSGLIAIERNLQCALRRRDRLLLRPGLISQLSSCVEIVFDFLKRSQDSLPIDCDRLIILSSGAFQLVLTFAPVEYRPE